MTSFNTTQQANLEALMLDQPSGVTTRLQAGMAVSIDSAATGVSRNFQVTRPDIASMKYPTFVVDARSAGAYQDGDKISGYRLGDRAIPRISVYTDQSITAGDVLNPMPTTYNFRRGAIFSQGGFIALETVDRSTTAGLVECRYTPQLTPQERLNAQVEWYDDFKNYTTAHDGWVAVATGTSAAVAAGTVQGNGSVLLTTGTSDNGSALLHGQTANAPLFPANGRAIYLESLMTFTVSATDVGFFFGATETPGATQPIPDTGTALATADLMGIWKAEATSVWAGSSYGASAAASSPSTAAFATATNYRFQMLYDGKGGIHYWVNGTSLGAPITTSTALPVVGMAPVFHFKNSSTTSHTASILHFACAAVK